MASNSSEPFDNAVIPSYDIVTIGAGMAGASLSAELAPHLKVLVAEAERMAGYHATGRSAAFWDECYGGPAIVPLTAASRAYLRDHGFLAERGAIYVGRDEDAAKSASFLAQYAGSGVRLERVGRAALEGRIPSLKPEWTHGISEPGCADIDVAGLHQHYLSAARRAGAEFRFGAALEHAERAGGVWHLSFSDGTEARAGVLVNAAGAWADQVAVMAGARPLGVVPWRRTVVQMRTDPQPPANLPLVLDISGGFYFKPEGNRLWLSPHDEGESLPCDAAPEEIDVAIAVERFQSVVDWEIQAIERKWAGLRSFAPDRRPIYGFDPQREGFFWLAGQGGFGIQTAPAAARLGAQLLRGRAADEMTEQLQPELYSPARFSLS